MTAWRLEEADGLLVAVCALLEGLPRVRHAFSTRRATSHDGAAEDFDLGAGSGLARAAKRRLRLARAAGLAQSPIEMRQVHGRRVVSLDGPRAAADGPVYEADGAISFGRDAGAGAPAVRTADCVALLLGDEEGRAVAALHAGWRGAAAGIVGAALDELRRRGVEPGRLRVALGPAIGPCCYVVGPEVRAAIEPRLGDRGAAAFRALAGDRCALDLRAALRLELEALGVEAGSVSMAPWCTACHPDLFYSHRRDGERAGRMMALIGLAP